MFNQIDIIQQEVNQFSSKELSEIENFRIAYLGKKERLLYFFNHSEKFRLNTKRIWSKAKHTQNSASEKVNTLKAEAVKSANKKSVIDYSLTAPTYKSWDKAPNIYN